MDKSLIKKKTKLTQEEIENPNIPSDCFFF